MTSWARLGFALLLVSLLSAACGSDDSSGTAGKGGSGGTGNKSGTGGKGGTGGSAASGGSAGSGNAAGTGGGTGGTSGGPSAGCIAGIATDPEAQQALPQAQVDTTWVAPTGKTVSVAAGGDVQAALDSAQPGDVVELAAGATFKGPFTLPVKSAAGFVIVRTSTADADLPPPGTRIDPSFASKLAKIEVDANIGAAIQTAPGAHGFRLVGLEISTSPGAYTTALVDISSGASSDAELASDIIIDRCYLHGDPAAGTRRGVALNGKNSAIVDSWLADFKEKGADSQAIAGWAGPGPFKIVNNHLEGSGENVIFGGADPKIANLVPSDIEICANHFFKPLSWRTDGWTVKNVLELKNARRVYAVGNVLENNWADAQVGFAVVFTPRNQDGTAPWSTVEDITFVLNVVRHSGSGVNMLGTDDLHPSQQQQRVLIRNNLLEDIDAATYGGQGRLFQLITPSNPAVQIKIDHNTANLAGNAFLTVGDTTVVGQNFVFTNNLVPKGDYGAFGSGKGEGNAALDFYLPGAKFEKNVIIGGNASVYPANNFFPADTNAVGFVDFASGGASLALAPSSQYAGAGNDGKDVGADFSALGPVFAVATP